MTIAVVVSLLWIGIFVFYLYTSQQQEKLEQEIDRLERKLDQEG